MEILNIIGGGLAGCEAAWKAAEQGIEVKLFEMRPNVTTGAHVTSYLGELVCSNSLGSNLINRASGLLKNELRLLGSLLIWCADETAVPAGGALAVGRFEFANLVTKQIMSHPNITVIREEVTSIPKSPTIIASGPLTSPALTEAILKMTNEENLFFFDAVSPIISIDSINLDIAFKSSRYGKGENEGGDYINCPLNKMQYERFTTELVHAKRIELKSFEEDIETGVKAGKHKFFEGCLPVEVIAQRGIKSLAFGPLRPVGLTDPRTGKRPYAVVQLRQDNIAGTLFNMVGFQTNIKYSEQKRIFRMIPGLEKAEFHRYGQMHRNTFIAAPLLLEQTLEFKGKKNIFFAGQITGVEGYAGNIATALNDL